MTDFALYHKGSWRDGQPRKFGPKTYCVSYDQKNDIYTVDQEDYSDFIEWVAIQWETDSTPADCDEDAQAYIDRLGVSVTEHGA